MSYGIVRLYREDGEVEREWRITAEQLAEHIASPSAPPYGCSQEDWTKGYARARCYGYGDP